MEKKFRVYLCSDLDYEEMVADICYEGRTFAMITQEKGIDKMEIEIFSAAEEEIKPWKFFLDDHLSAIKLAKETLIKTQKIEENN